MTESTTYITVTSSTELQKITAQLVGLPMCRMLNAYAFFLYIHFGECHDGDGDWTLCVEGAWKFCRGKIVVADSTTEERDTLDPKVANIEVEKPTVVSFSFVEDGKNIVVELSNGMTLKTETIEDETRLRTWDLCQRETNTYFLPG